MERVQCPWKTSPLNQHLLRFTMKSICCNYWTIDSSATERKQRLTSSGTQAKCAQEEPDYWFIGTDYPKSYNLIKLASKSTIHKWPFLYINTIDGIFFFFFLSKGFHFKPLILALNTNGWLSPGVTDLKPSKQPAALI